MSSQPDEIRRRLGDFIRKRREDLGISMSELERRTGIHQSRLSRWERAIDMPTRPERLTALAQGLQVPATDLYLLAGMELSPELPSMQPYLRSKYGTQLPPEAIADIEAYSRQVAGRYGVSTGPGPGEDE